MLTEHADQSALVPHYHPASVSGSCCAPHFPTNIVTPAGEFQADRELRDLLVGTIVDSFQGCGPKQLAQSAQHTAHGTQHYSYSERCNGRSATVSSCTFVGRASLKQSTGLSAAQVQELSCG
jgi:hypothetical protein